MPTMKSVKTTMEPHQNPCFQCYLPPDQYLSAYSGYLGKAEKQLGIKPATRPSYYVRKPLRVPRPTRLASKRPNGPSPCQKLMCRPKLQGVMNRPGPPGVTRDTTPVKRSLPKRMRDSLKLGAKKARRSIRKIGQSLGRIFSWRLPRMNCEERTKKEKQKNLKREAAKLRKRERDDRIRHFFFGWF